jgi:sec-independent protein translocase protein TatC
MVTNSNFNFRRNEIITLELPFSEHISELRQRILFIFVTISCLTIISFIEVKNIVKTLEYPINNVRFFQNSPGEYFISTIKISFYTGLLFTGPFSISQAILFLLPGLTKKEAKVILPLLISSLILFGLGITFSYYTLIPAALSFFLNYSQEVIEPFWSFDQYFEFILVLFYSTGLSFQIPIIQILLGLLNIVSASQMLNAWKYVILFATILGAILTPSTDPLTQLLLSVAILMLYFTGLSILFLIKN